MKKTRIVISKCLGFGRCRYDGKTASYPIINKLKGRFDFLPVCPEIAIGLGVPRHKIRLVRGKSGVKLIQPYTGKDLTKKMERFTKSFLHSTKSAGGFIIKARSPSCGIGDAKIYASIKSRRPIGKGTGLFAQAILCKYPRILVGNERYLTMLDRGEKDI